MLKINKVKYLNGYTLLVRFNTGVVKSIDFESLLAGEIYKPLKNLEFFKKVTLDCGTVSWPNGADFAPEFLYKKGKVFKQKVAAQYQILAVPEICSFDGIRIFMNYNDHLPPHFHAEFGNDEALVAINECALQEGHLPTNKLKKVISWAKQRQEQLIRNWELARDKQPLEKILPLPKK